MNIINVNGREISSGHKNDKFKEWLNQFDWIFIGKLVLIGPLIYNILNIIFEQIYAVQCLTFYGVPDKYFRNMGVFRDNLVNLLFFMVILFYPFIFTFLHKYLSSRLDKFIWFLFIMILLFKSTLVIFVIIEEINKEWFQNILINYIILTILILTSGIIACFLVINQNDDKYYRIKFAKSKRILLSISFGIYLGNITLGIILTLSRTVSDKKIYEICYLDNQIKVIVSEYNNMYVTMNGEINELNLSILKNNGYELIPTSGIPIKNIMFEYVECISKE